MLRSILLVATISLLAGSIPALLKLNRATNGASPIGAVWGVTEMSA